MSFLVSHPQTSLLHCQKVIQVIEVIDQSNQFLSAPSSLGFDKNKHSSF